MNPNLLAELTIHCVSMLFPHENVEKRNLLHFHVRISKNSDALKKFFGQIRIQRKKLRRKTFSDNVSLKNEIFTYFLSLKQKRWCYFLVGFVFSASKYNSRVSIPALYTLFSVGLCYSNSCIIESSKQYQTPKFFR